VSPQPNILVIMTDQQKATASHLWGNAFCQTPHLARLAAEGVLYEHAITPHPLCMPARVAFWTGRYAHSTGSRRNETPMKPDALHAFKLWKETGYRCGLIGKNHCFSEQSDLDLFDIWCEIGHGGLPTGPTTGPTTKGMEWFRPIDGIHAAHELRRTLTPQNPRFGYAISDHLPLEDHSTGLVAGQTVRFLEEQGDQPFALWVSFPDPHEPWVCPRSYFEEMEDQVQLPPWRPGEFNDGTAPERNRALYEMVGVRNEEIDELRGLLAAYYGMVRFLDDGVGQILDALERTGLRENTIVVFCSDHGDFMGEHRMQCKGGVFYDALVRVPLILSWPGQIPQGVRDDSLVNLVDIVPTIFHLQGAESPASFQGDPLPSATETSPRDAAFSEYGAGGPLFGLSDLARLPEPHGRRTLLQTLRWREAEGRRKMVRTQGWKYVHDPMGDRDELYDLVEDPWELTNVVDDPANGPVLADLRLRLADWSIRTEDSPPVPLPTPGGSGQREGEALPPM
jgi:arylsulfatase